MSGKIASTGSGPSERPLSASTSWRCSPADWPFTSTVKWLPFGLLSESETEAFSDASDRRHPRYVSSAEVLNREAHLSSVSCPLQGFPPVQPCPVGARRLAARTIKLTSAVKRRARSLVGKIAHRYRIAATTSGASRDRPAVQC